MQAVGKTVIEFDSLSRRLLLKLYIYRVSIGSSAIVTVGTVGGQQEGL